MLDLEAVHHPEIKRQVQNPLDAVEEHEDRTVVTVPAAERRPLPCQNSEATSQDARHKNDWEQATSASAGVYSRRTPYFGSPACRLI